MPPPNDPLFHLAAVIHRRYVQQPSEVAETAIEEDSWQRCLTLSRRLNTLRKLGWLAAAHHQQSALRAELEEHVREVQKNLQILTTPVPGRPQTTVRTIYDEIRALYDEFTDVDFNLRAYTLAVTTEPISLEGVFLGPFKIQWYWNSLPTSPLYDVIALDPQPAGTSESTTHPHVQSDVLCAGEGTIPIRRALADGRLLDFFQIVNQTLSTYNPSSPYVALDDWHGVPCADCDTTTSEDFRSSCAACHGTLCDECCSTCDGCSDSLCSACFQRCSACEDIYCRDCLQTCPHCSARVCSACYDDENERCNLCHEKSNEEGEAGTCENGQPATARQHVADTAGAAIQSHGLGQATVPARLR